MDEVGPLIISTVRTCTTSEPRRLTCGMKNIYFTAWCLACRFCLYKVMDTVSEGSLVPFLCGPRTIIHREYPFQICQ